ncbi:MAG TPA: hypothetical protein VEZ47_05645, partial [Gemmatirosa sp.]|nr:hypothetical protein [Gemmatirosa sp.]
MTTVDLPPREHGARTSTSRPATLREHDDAVLAQAETSCRPPLARAVGAALLGGLLAGIAAPGRAQPPLATTAAMAMAADSARVDARPRVGPLAGAAATGGLILLGAAGAQALRTPTAWPRTAGGFGRRVADQTGFYLVQTGAQR